MTEKRKAADEEPIVIEGAYCPVPLAHDQTIVLGHGSGGKLTQSLIESVFYPPFENERLLLYFMTFLLGVLCYRQNVFAEKPKSKTLYTIANSVAWLPVTGHIFARLWPFFSPNPAEFPITPLYQLIWHLSFYLSLLCLMYIIIESFWRYLDKSGKLWSELNRNSYGVYIIHVIVIGIFGTLLLNLNIPAVVKYLILFLSTYVGSNLIVSVYRSLVQALKSSRRNFPSRATDAA
jgi:hypothetical protein